MNSPVLKLALGVTVALMAVCPRASAQRGGGYRGGGGGYRGGYGGQMGGGMSHSPSFSQPHPPMNQSGSYGNRSQYGNQSGSGSRSPYGSAAGGAYPNQSSSHPAGAAAAGAGYANQRQSSAYPNAGAAAAGAGYAYHNQGSGYPYAGAAVAGAGYGYNHAGMGTGYWGGNYYPGWGATGWGMGYGSGVGAWGAGSPMYGWGYSGYSNPYYGGYGGAGGVPQGAAVQQPANVQQATAAPAYDYTQPISTSAAPPDQSITGQASSAFDQAREAFKAGDYDKALQLDLRALGQTPNDSTLHEFLGLTYFAQGQYQQAAPALYAVLSVRPGWNWTTLSGMYADVETYTRQLRALEAYLKENPDSAPAHFVLAYHYLTEGHDPNAVAQLKQVVRLQPGDTLSAQLIEQFQPAGGNAAPPPTAAAPVSAAGAEGKLPGQWAAVPAPAAKIALVIEDDGAFTWTVNNSGKPPVSITGKSTFADGVLTLAAQGGQHGALAGQVAWQDPDHFTFRLVGGPANDPGLKFAR